MQIAERIEQITSDINGLISRLIHSPYAFALWKYPKSNTSFLIIDLDTDKTSDISESSIEELSDCFVVNSYANSHPPKPQCINASILIELKDGENQLNIHPKTSSSKLEVFLQDIESIDEKTSSSESINKSESSTYIQSVESALEQIETGGLQKVVLSRYKDIHLSEASRPYEIFREASQRYPNAFSYLINTNEHGLWLGVTPERLITIENNRYFTTDALAGTQVLQDGVSLAQIAWTQKEIQEQAMVSRYIIDCFKEIRLREFNEVGPQTVQAGNLAHLKTAFTVDMEATNSPMLGSIMLELLHPTSAVCGFPREIARDFIHNHEDFDRELFSGFLGPVNFKGRTSLFVNLRCMKISGDKARLFAGAGITADSNPEKELEETNHKMTTLLSVLQAQ